MCHKCLPLKSQALALALWVKIRCPASSVKKCVVEKSRLHPTIEHSRVIRSQIPGRSKLQRAGSQLNQATLWRNLWRNLLKLTLLAVILMIIKHLTQRVLKAEVKLSLGQTKVKTTFTAIERFEPFVLKRFTADSMRASKKMTRARGQNGKRLKKTLHCNTLQICSQNYMKDDKTRWNAMKHSISMHFQSVQNKSGSSKDRQSLWCYPKSTYRNPSASPTAVVHCFSFSMRFRPVLACQQDSKQSKI